MSPSTIRKSSPHGARMLRAGFVEGWIGTIDVDFLDLIHLRLPNRRSSDKRCRLGALIGPVHNQTDLFTIAYRCSLQVVVD